jgi:hypothetical protein
VPHTYSSSSLKGKDRRITVWRQLGGKKIRMTLSQRIHHSAVIHHSGDVRRRLAGPKMHDPIWKVTKNQKRMEAWLKWYNVLSAHAKPWVQIQTTTNNSNYNNASWNSANSFHMHAECNLKSTTCNSCSLKNEKLCCQTDNIIIHIL